MRRVIQRTVRTTKIVSLTITHSESEEAVEYSLTSGSDQLEAATPPESTEAESIEAEPDVVVEPLPDETPDALRDAANREEDQAEAAN